MERKSHNPIVPVNGRRRPNRKSQRNRAITALQQLNPNAYALTHVPLYQLGKQRREKLLYSEGFTLTSTTGVISGYVFTANGCYDPNITGTGHQPIGFDQIMLSYEQYCVVASTATFTVFTSSGANIYANVAVSLNPDTTVPSDWNRMIENGLNTSVMLYPTGVFGSKSDLTLSCNVQRYFGRPDAANMLNSEELCGSAGANPVEQVYYTLSLQDALVTSSVTIGCWVKIVYDVIFWENKKLTSS